MKQLVLDISPEDGASLQLTGETFHYLVNVRREKTGHVISTLSPNGTPGRLLIQEIGKDFLLGEWKSLDLKNTKERHLTVTLYPAALKGNKLDDVLRQSVESGIASWHPWIAHHSISRPDSERGRERWLKITREALQQSGRTTPVETIGYSDYTQMCVRWRVEKTLLVFHHEPLHSVGFHSVLRDDVSQVGLVFGPEGGLNREEVLFFQDINAHFIWLGSGILRSETAIIYSLGAIKTIFQEKALWKTP